MDNFKIIYKILKMLEVSMDYDEFDMRTISADELKVSENRLNSIMQMLLNDGYIEGGNIINMMGGISGIKWIRPQITLRGLEYLQENSMMKKAANLAKGAADLIP